MTAPTSGPAVEVLWTARYDYQPNSKLKRHRHEYFQLIYCISGEGSFLLGGSSLPLAAGTLFLIKPRKFHGLSATKLVKTLDLKFEVPDAGLSDRLAESNELMHDPPPAVVRLFEQIRQEGELRAPLYRQVCDALLLQILAYIIRLDTPGGVNDGEGNASGAEDLLPTSEIARTVVEFIRKQYGAKLTVRDMALAVGRSDRLVRDLMQRAVGMPPMRYVMRYRVEKAKEFIKHSDYSFKEIAGLTGFSTIHHFTRIFHQMTNETPGAWRRKYRQGICKDVCIDPNFSNVILTVAPGEARHDGKSAR